MQSGMNLGSWERGYPGESAPGIPDSCYRSQDICFQIVL